MSTIAVATWAAALPAFASHAGAQESRGAAHVVAGENVEIGRWTLRSGAEIGLEYAPSERTQLLRIDGTIARRFGQNRQVDAVAFAADRSICVIHVSEVVHDASHLLTFLVLKDRPEPGTGDVQMVETIHQAQLMDVGGKRTFVMEMGSVVRYPLVDIYMGMSNPKEASPLTEYGWQRWNLETGEWLGGIPSEEAEAREAAARREGNLVSFLRF